MVDSLTFSTLGSEGRLGNQLWQIASTMGIAATRGETVSFPAWEYEPYFSVPHSFFAGGFGTESMLTENAEIIPFAHRPYLQRLSLWANVQDEIRVMFSPSESALESLDQRYGHYLDPSVHFTAVHVRRTDAVASQEYFKVPFMDYFEPAMSLVVNDAPHTTFLVFSDDIEWCEANFPKSHNGCAVEMVSPKLPEPKRNFRGDPMGNAGDWQEFFLMRSCAQHITSNSTFSWWAAWLSTNREPITPAVWYGPRYINELHLDHFLPPEWRRL